MSLIKTGLSLVKYFFKSLSEKKSISRYVPVMEQAETLFELIEKKAIVPSEKEKNENLPSRSAKLRYVKKKKQIFMISKLIFWINLKT